ncbi:hypothetical protein [Ignavibacterium sp.]|uniref:hypothetical protein n=1 Tax=Ignavibacterium sp. TaxID=2651167 RepID=UPI0021FEF07B|nr:hypothetical protein [Ignavibacterium sp.]BDQ02018.1 MAG: hypothetical protein KatS3mg037_0593 [Ignavibacterium sp.]
MKISVIFFLIIILIIAIPLLAQQDSQSENSNFVKENFRIGGEIGAYGEYYTTNNEFARRPNATGRLFFRPTIDLFDLIQIPFEFLISTEGSSARQNINQFGINPKWSWGSLHLGDFSTEYSRYTLSGVLIRGGGINLNPGNFRFSTAAGFTRRSVPGGAQDGSFKRFLLASKIGYGNESVSFLDLIFLRAKDEISSLDRNDKSITILSPNGNDVLDIGALISITWNSVNVGGAIKIELSRDGGSTFEIIADNQPNVGFYNWTVTGPISFEALIKVSSQDDSTVFDLSDNYFSIGSGVQTSIVSNKNNIINQNSVTPQENLVLGTKGKISFLNNVVSFDFDAAGSVYSRDLRASELNLDSSDIPSFISKIYKPRVGTNYDFAFNTSLALRFSAFSTKIGYRRIQPGYNSLGTAYLHNDIQEFSIMNNIRISTVNLNLSYIRQTDNLLDQKIFTTARNIITAGINVRLTNSWTSTVTGNLLFMANDSNNDSTKIDFNNLVLNFNNNFSVDPKGFMKTININYSLQNTDNKSYLLKNNTTIIHSLNLGLGFGITSDLSSNFSAGFVNSSIFDTVKSFTHNYALNFQNKAFSNKLNSALNLSTAFNQGNKSYRASLSNGYNLTDADNITLSFSFMRFDGKTFRGGSFNEFITSLSYNHRF